MILAFMGIAAALYGGMMLSAVVTAFQRPFMWLILTGEPLTPEVMTVGAVIAAVMVGGGYGALSHGLAGVA